VFQRLLQMVPHIKERLMEGSEKSCMTIADLVSPSFQRVMNFVSLIEDSKGHI